MLAVDHGPALLPGCLQVATVGISEGWQPFPAIPVTCQTWLFAVAGWRTICMLDCCLCRQRAGPAHRIAHAPALLKYLVLHRQPYQSAPCSRAMAAKFPAVSLRQHIPTCAGDASTSRFRFLAASLGISSQTCHHFGPSPTSLSSLTDSLQRRHEPICGYLVSVVTGRSS